jgi:hypothetical protein
MSDFKVPFWLEDAYVHQNMSPAEIAKLCKTSEYEVKYHLEMYGISKEDLSENFFK